MSDIKITLGIEILIPTLEVYKEYFNNKYPCTNSENDGSKMTLEDEIKFGMYNNLLSIYRDYECVAISEYNHFKSKITDNLS